MKTAGMRLLTGAVALVLLWGCGKNMSEKYSKVLMIDSYDGPINSRTVDSGAPSGSRIEVSGYVGAKKCGSKSLRIKYLLGEGGYMYAARGFNLDAPGAAWTGPQPDQIAWSDYTGFSLQVFGSKRGPIAFDVKDNGGELHRFFIDDNFNGWKEIYVPYSSFTSRTDWQPQTATANKKLDFPIWSYQFEPKQPGEGQVYFDCVAIVKE